VTWALIGLGWELSRDVSAAGAGGGGGGGIQSQSQGVAAPLLAGNE
jgi:hypothetical protein